MTSPTSWSYSPSYDLIHLRILLTSVWSYQPPDLTHLRMILLASGSSPPYDLIHLLWPYNHIRILLTSVWSYSPPYDLTNLRILFTSGSYSPPYDLTHLRILLTSVWSDPPPDLTHLRMIWPTSGSYSPPYDLTHLRMILTHLRMILLTCMTLLNCVDIITIPYIRVTWLTSIWQNSPMSRTSPSSPQFTQMLSLNMICAQQGKGNGTLHRDF